MEYLLLGLGAATLEVAFIAVAVVLVSSVRKLFR